jgi:hypothetical protein
MTEEYAIAAYLLAHGDVIRSDLRSREYGWSSATAPMEDYREALTSEVVQTLAEALQLNVEQVSSVVTEKYLVSLLGEEWFS